MIFREFAGIAKDVREYRYLLFQLAMRDVKLRYKQAVMGLAWAIFMPSLIVLAGLAVRIGMAHFAGRAIEGSEIAALAVKALPWAFFVGTVQFATSSLTGNMNLVTKIYFPREVLPLATTAAQMFDTAIACTVLAIVLPFLGVWPSVASLAAIPLALLFLTLTAGTAIFLSCANLFFRDVKYIVQVLLTFGIFFTPVFFEPNTFGELGARLMMLNPLAPFLEGFRLAIVEQHNILLPLTEASGNQWSPGWLAYGAAWAIFMPAASTLLFHRMQILFAEYA